MGRVFPAAVVMLAMLAGLHSQTDLSGTWSGSGADFWTKVGGPDGMRVTMNLTQTGTAVSGTVTSTNLGSVNDGTCSGCHRVKQGTVTGTLSGNALTIALSFPGLPGEITPNCSAQFSGTGDVTSSPLTIGYSVNDSCEGQFENGTLQIAPGPPSAPAIATQPQGSVVAAGQRVTLGVVILGTPPLAYQWYLGNAGVTTTPIAGATSRDYLTEPVVGPVSYWVRVTNYLGAANSSGAVLDAASDVFTDADLAAGMDSIRAVHIAELRTRINQLRTRFGLPAYAFENPSLAPQQTAVRVVHVEQLRAALVEAYVAAGREAPAFTHAALIGATIRAIHITELRNAVLALE